jgi:hypothetical protein
MLAEDAIKSAIKDYKSKREQAGLTPTLRPEAVRVGESAAVDAGAA